MERLHLPRILLLALFAFGLFSCEEGEDRSPTPPDAVTLAELISALDRPGQVFYAEYDFPPEGDQTLSFRLWYSAERETARVEFVNSGNVDTVRIFAGDRIVSHDFREGRTDLDTPELPADLPSVAVLAIEHLRPWFAAEDTPSIDSQERDGRPAIHATALRVLEEGTSDEPAGTKFTFESWLDSKSLLPLHARMTMAIPGGQDSGEMDITYRTAEFLPADSLPADHFDADTLAALEVTLDEALGLAANQPFATFWLGEQIPVPWDAPDGRHHDAVELTDVQAPGTARGSDSVVSLWYSAPPSFFGGLLMVLQGPAATFEPLRTSEFDAMESAGKRPSPRHAFRLHLRTLGAQRMFVRGGAGGGPLPHAC